MTPNEIIQQIQAKKPEITQQQIMENLETEKKRSGGLLGDETLLRLIAARFGIEIPYNRFYPSNLSSKHLFAGLNDVTVEGRLLAVFPSKTFSKGDKSGKFATLFLADGDGLLRVVLWDKKADMVDNGQLKTNQVICLRHGYTKADRSGKAEMHMGTKSKIEIQDSTSCQYPTSEKFAIKISQLSRDNQPVFLLGTVKEVSGLSRFSRNDQSDGSFLRFILVDDSGQVNVVAWNETAEELQKVLKAGVMLQLVNARVREAQNGGLELHVDSNVLANILEP
ncbi:MAG: OB-fold nucleic acid binding domain-containing protein [Candidatus Bathyarchaeota archaeon]|nr:OB-fold nucleic acid binding domain-containing protein [Candidatus Bathyarchaeota archaeon]